MHSPPLVLPPPCKRGRTAQKLGGVRHENGKLGIGRLKNWALPGMKMGGNQVVQGVKMGENQGANRVACKPGGAQRENRMAHSTEMGENQAAHGVKTGSVQRKNVDKPGGGRHKKWAAHMENWVARGAKTGHCTAQKWGNASAHTGAVLPSVT